MLSIQQDTTQGSQEQKSYQERLHEWFGSPKSGLPRSLTTLELGNQFYPGEIWKLVKTEEDKKFYQYKFENGNWNVVEVDGNGKIRGIEIRIASSSAEFLEELTSYCKEQFDTYLKSGMDTGSNFIYRFYEWGYGIIEGVSLEIIGGGPPYSYIVWLYRGELKKY